jgi:putative spermidine/putrescine transport system permease protein
VTAAVLRDRRWIGRAALGAAVLVGYAVIVSPLVLVSWLAFFRNEVVSFPPEGYTLRWFGNILDQNNFVEGFVVSLQVGLFARPTGPSARPSRSC